MLTSQSQNAFKQAINQNGNGLAMDRYIYSNQDGAGLGGIFSKIFKWAMPLAKKAINTGYKAVQPHLQTLGESVIDTTQQIAQDKLISAANSAKYRIKKRKTADASVPEPLKLRNE